MLPSNSSSRRRRSSAGIQEMLVKLNIVFFFYHERKHRIIQKWWMYSIFCRGKKEMIVESMHRCIVRHVVSLSRGAAKDSGLQVELWQWAPMSQTWIYLYIFSLFDARYNKIPITKKMYQSDILIVDRTGVLDQAKFRGQRWRRVLRTIYLPI